MSNLSTFTWGVIELGHRGDIEEVSPESQQVDQRGHEVQPQFTRFLSPQLVKTAELDPSRNYLAGFHPHGVLSIGVFTNLCSGSTGFFSVFPGIQPHVTTINIFFWIPFFRDYIMQGGKPSQNWKAQENEGCRHGGGISGRASKNSVIPPRTCVVEKEARPKEALPTALFPAMSLVRGWEERNDSIPVLRELPAVGGG